MSENSKIEWLAGGSTWNPIRARNRKTGKVGWFCTKPSPGCAGCYAEKMNKNTYFGNGIRYAVDQHHLVELFLDEKLLMQPLHWRKGRLIFPCSMTDWQADFVPDEWRDKMLAVMALTPQHTYLTLTKRAGRQRAYLSPSIGNVPGSRRVGNIQLAADEIMGDLGAAHHMMDAAGWPIKNLWLGVSTESQSYADSRIPELLQTPAAVRWVSAEPLLSQLEIAVYLGKEMRGGLRQDMPGIDWLVCGGESGQNARPMHPDWARSLRDQCKVAGVPFFFKQNGEWMNAEAAGYPELKDATVNHAEQCLFATDGTRWNTVTIPHEKRDNAVRMLKVGKKAAGRLLDGKEHSEYPSRERRASR